MIRLRSFVSPARVAVLATATLAACGGQVDGGPSPAPSLASTDQAATGLASAAAPACDIPTGYTLASSSVTSKTTSQGLAVTISYRTVAGATGRAVWIDSPTQRRVEFYPGGMLLLAVDFPDGKKLAHAKVSAAVAAKQLAQFYYVFPQLRRVADARGLTLTPRGTTESGDCTAEYQAFGECILQCSPGTAVPDGIGASCHTAIYDPDIGCVFNDYCESENPCNTCCDALIDCPGEGGGGGGFGVACDIDDIYCNALYSPSNNDW